MDIPRASPKTSPLRTSPRSVYSPSVATMNPNQVSERARRRLREEMDTRGISQRDLAEMLTDRSREAWSQPRVGKVLTGKVNLRLEEVALIADCLGLPLVEVLRDRGLEFYAELTPTEVRFLERIRQWPELLPGLTQVLDIRAKMLVGVPRQSTRRKVGRPRNSELSGKPT